MGLLELIGNVFIGTIPLWFGDTLGGYLEREDRAGVIAMILIAVAYAAWLAAFIYQVMEVG